jgi:hypothetical protein
MAQSGRGSVRVYFTEEGRARSGLLETGHPYPNVEWTIDGGTLFMKFTGGSTSGNQWDYIFGPSKWLSIEMIN